MSSLFSPLYEADDCFDRELMYYQDTESSIHPIVKQTLNQVFPMTCINRNKNFTALDTDDDGKHVLTPKPVIRTNLMLF